jgi:inorganic pyrophosphatase
MDRDERHAAFALVEAARLATTIGPAGPHLRPNRSPGCGLRRPRRGNRPAPRYDCTAGTWRGAANIDYERFWQLADALVAASEIIDRPRGSTHPRYPEFFYPLDYGFVAQTRAIDGGGVDVWVGSLPERRVTGAIVTIDALKRDAEVKLLIGCTRDEAAQALTGQNHGRQAGVLLWRGSHDGSGATGGIGCSWAMETAIKMSLGQIMPPCRSRLASPSCRGGLSLR